MRNSTKKRIGALSIAFALFLSMAMSLAYFTDRAEMNVSVTSGTVGIDEDASENWLTQLQDGPQPLDNINPGDSRSLKFTVENTDNKAIDVRHTIKLSVVDAAGNAKSMSMRTDIAGSKSSLDNPTQMLQFDIFKASDVTTISNDGNAGYEIIDGAQPLFSSDTVDPDTLMGASRVINEEKGIVTYYFADSILDGTGKQAETGYANAEQSTTSLTATDAVLGSKGTAVTYDYILIFRDNTLNDFQGCKLHVELVVEAKQHLNTNSSWENVYTNQYVLNASGKSIQDTIINTAPDNQTGVLNQENASAEDTEGHTGLTYEADGDASVYNTQGDSGKE